MSEDKKIEEALKTVGEAIKSGTYKTDVKKLIIEQRDKEILQTCEASWYWEEFVKNNSLRLASHSKNTLLFQDEVISESMLKNELEVQFDTWKNHFERENKTKVKYGIKQ